MQSSRAISQTCAPSTDRDLAATLNRLADALETRSDTPPAELIDAGGVGRLLVIGERTVRRLDVEGRLPMPVKIDGSIRWRLSELRQWIDAGCPARQKGESLRLQGRHYF